MFWTIFKADLLFGICSVSFTLLVTIAVTWWKRRRAKRLVAAKALFGPDVRPFESPFDGPSTVIIGGKGLNPEHCPLCGREWPLPGPVQETKIIKPDPE